MQVIVRALIRWSWVLLLCLLIGLFAGKAIASLLPPTYQATSIVQLNVQHSAASSAIQPIAAYATLVTSDSVLGEAIKNYPGLDRQSIGTKQLVVTPTNSSQTISIQVTLPKAKEAEGLANDLAQLLVTQQNANIKAGLAKELQIVDARISSEQKSIDSLNQKIIQLSTTPELATQNAAQIQQYQNEVNQYQQLKNQDINQQQSLLTDQALYSSPLSIVQTATTPTKPSSITGYVPIAPLIVVVMLLVGLGLIAFLEPSIGRINGVYALQKKVALPVLGALHWTSPSPMSVPLRTIIDSKRPYAEECRVMMADVLFHAEDAQAHVLAMTSLKGQAGSSSIASELAALLAQSKRSVLLIDANLYSPVQHKRLSVSNDAGLAKMLEDLRLMRSTLVSEEQQPLQIAQQEVSMVETHRVASVSGRGRSIAKIQQQASSANGQSSTGPSSKIVDITDRFPFDSYIQSTSIQNLYLLPAGKSTVNSSALLSMPEMEQFLEWAAKPIDFVVIDCPALVHAEAHVLGSLSDQTYVVVDATRDRMRHVVNAKEELTSTGLKLSGLILNKLGRWI